MKKKTEMLTLWHSLTSGRHACQDVWNCRGLEPRLRCSRNLQAADDLRWCYWCFGQIFYHLERCLILSILTTVHPSFFSRFHWNVVKPRKISTPVGCQFGDQIALNSNGIFRILPSQLNIKIRYGQLSPKLLRKSLFCNFKINSWHLSAVAINRLT